MASVDPTLARVLESFAIGSAGIAAAYASGRLDQVAAFEALGELIETLIPEAAHGGPTPGFTFTATPSPADRGRR